MLLQQPASAEGLLEDTPILPSQMAVTNPDGLAVGLLIGALGAVLTLW